MAENGQSRDNDGAKGAVENDRPEAPTNTNLHGQNPHHFYDELPKDHDTDFPEPGSSPEHSGQKQGSIPGTAIKPDVETTSRCCR
jgi:hypothetical protein